MVSKIRGRNLKIVALLSVIVMVIGVLVGQIYSTDDNHYVLDVVKESATESDNNLQVTEKIVKGENEQYFNSKELNYEVELKNISQAENIETQVAIVIDSSYSMETNDTNNVVKAKAIELANGILDNVRKSRVSISNNNNTKVGMTDYRTAVATSKNTIATQINGLISGEGSDSNIGLDNATKTFTTAIDSKDTINKYIIVFTDSTDDVAEKMQSLDSSIKVISILVDMTSTSYIVDNSPVRGDVYLLLSELTESDITGNVDLLDLQRIYNEMNSTVNNIEINNAFSDEILTYFNISDINANVGTVEKTETGYKWNIDKIKYQETAKLTYSIELRTNMDINAGLIFEELYTNKTQDIKYTIFNGDEIQTLNGTDSREGTESTVIKICQGYDLKIKAVNESNTDLAVEGVEFKVVGINEAEEEVCNLTKITDSDGYITITADEARALRGDGIITFTVSPSINKVGYVSTDSSTFKVNNNKQTKKIEWNDIGTDLEYTIKEENRSLEVVLPINSQRIDFELKVEELNNSNVVISGAEFELIQPKLNNKYEMDVLTGTTDEDGIIHFAPTVMTKDGTYNYILRQVTAPEGYDVTVLTLVTITFKDGVIVSAPTTQFNPNVVNSELCEDKENHVLIEIGNECVAQDPFDLQINLQDSANGTKLEGVTYLIRTINSNNISRSEYATTDENGQINTKVYGKGNLRIEITEQSPKTGYAADTKTKELIVNRDNKIITIWNTNPTNLNKEQDPNKENIIVNLTSQKKAEQNIVKLTIVDSNEIDVPVGEGIVYRLTDTETERTYGPEVSNRNGEVKFTIDTKAQGQHAYILEVDDSLLPEEYSNEQNETQILVNLVFDEDGYIIDENIANGSEMVIEDHAARIDNESYIEHTAFITIGYEMNIGNTMEFKVQLSDKEDLKTKIEGASYNINIEWDIGEKTRTKTITGRRTNKNGEITTRIVKGEEVRIYVTQVGASVGYNLDLTTQEIYVRFNNNGTMNITQTPYDLGATNTEEPNQGAQEVSGVLVYKHLNKKRSVEDTYLNLTINKKDTNGAYVDGVYLKIESSTLVDKNNSPLKLIKKTGEKGSEGTVTIDYAEYVKNQIENEIIRVPGIGESGEEIVYELDITEVKVNGENTTQFVEKPGTTVKLRLIFRYKDNRVTLTNAETIYGNRLVINKIFSSSSDTAEGQQSEDTMGVFLSNVTLDLYTNYDDVGNLSLDFKKENKDGKELVGAEYTLKVTNPDATVIRKDITISNGENSEDIEISGINVNVGSIIELTEKTAPIGYGINTSTEILEVVEISDDGEITLEQKDISYNPNRLKLERLASSITSAETVKTNYQVTFIDYQLDIFEFEITAKDINSQKGVEGYGFRIDSSRGATNTITTEKNGTGSATIGGNIENETITYTISANKIAEYYKPLNSLINVNVVFNEFGKVDTVATQNAQVDPNYGTLWTITTINDSNFGKIGIEILVEHQDPLVVKVETIDKITNANINGTTYKITPSEELPATGSTSIDVGYVLQNGAKTYTLAQTSIKNSYEKLANKAFTVTYKDEALIKAEFLNNTVLEDTITITGDKEITIKLYVEPKVPFEITNLYYFDTNVKLQGANFEVISQRNQDSGIGTTDANGKAGIYSDIFMTNEDVMYKVKQTKGATGYATVEDFYVKVTYNENREITAAKLVTQYGEEVTDNRFVTVSFVKTSTYSNYNSNDKGIVTIQVLNYPEFKILIENVDRRDGTTKIVGTEYSVKSTYVESDNSIVDFTQTSGVITNQDGIGTAHLDKTRDNTVVTYTVTETKPATGYQSLGTEIQVEVTFDENGYVSNVQTVNDTNLSNIEHVNKIEPVVNPEDNFTIELQLKNNPILKFNLIAQDIADTSIKIKDIGFQIVSKVDEKVYSNSSATNRVNQTQNAETSYTDINGYTASYLDRTLDNKDMYYTITEVQKSPGYQWADEDIIIKVAYDSDGKISTVTPVQGEGFINIIGFDADNFEISIDVYNNEIKEFGIHLNAVDTYNSNKKLNDMKVEAFLIDPQNQSYASDGKYELVGENALLTGEDRNNDGTPDLTYGEDYKIIGAYTEGAGTRTLRLVIKNDSYQTAQSGYYLQSSDGSKSGNSVGYYEGSKYFVDAKYQTVKYEYLINVTFDDEGKITDARLNTGLNGNIGWLTDDRYIEVNKDGTLNHTDYRLNITMKFFPMFELKLNAMDNYTYQNEIDENGKPISLPGAKYTVSTQRHTDGYRQKDEFVEAGYIGYGNHYGGNSSVVHGSIYEDTDRLLVPIEKGHSRLFFVYEQVEPTNYQKTNPWHLTHRSQRLVAIIKVTFNEYGEVDYENSIERVLGGNTIKPYIAEGGNSYLSDNNIPEYNYYYDKQSANRNINFYIGYGLTTKIYVNAIDDILNGHVISNIKAYPFIGDTYCTSQSYEYNTISYRTTDSMGEFAVKYWGAAEQNTTNRYIIGSERQGNEYNGYLFPSDMASPSLGGSGNPEDYYVKLDITYDSNGKISDVTSVGSDLWGDDNVVEQWEFVGFKKDENGNLEMDANGEFIPIYAKKMWDSNTGTVWITILYSRNFQMTLNKTDYYDSTINNLVAAFNVISNKGLRTSVNSRTMTSIGKVYKDTTVKYTLSETQVPNGYYPLTDTIDYYVTFDKDGNIATNTVQTLSEYFEVVSTSDTTRKVNKTSPDLTINVKDKPAINLDLRVIDKFYKNDGIADVYLKVTNDKGDTALGNPQTDANGYARIVTPVYPGETVKYNITQTNTAPGYYQNSTTIELEVEFNDAGKIQNYRIISGNEVINNFNTTGFMNTRQISMQIMNMPKDLKIGLYKYDELTNQPMASVQFTITKEDMNSGVKEEKTIVTENNGAVIQTIDTFDTSLQGKTIKYTIHEDETPATYRTMQDIVFIIRYNADGSIGSYNQVPNDNGVLTDIVPGIARGTIKYLNEERVNFKVEVPNDNAYDIIIKNEDINYAGFGIEGSQFDVSVNGTTYTPALTNASGITSVNNLTHSGDITIRIAQAAAGDGYRDDVDNTVEIKLVKGIDIYSIDLKPETDGYIDDKNATTTKAIVKVDETYGTITVTFKNETKTELTVLKQDVNSKVALQGAEFEVTAKQVDNSGNIIGEEIILTTEENKVTNVNGQLYFDLGVAPQSQIWVYTIKEITPPEGYNPIIDLELTVTYDQYGRVYGNMTSNKLSRMRPTTEHADNENCRSMYAIVYNGDVSPAYTVKVVTEDADTGKRINGSRIYLNMTDEDGMQIPVEPKTNASAGNGTSSVTGNLGINGLMYTDEEIEAEDENGNKIHNVIIIEKGLTYVDNIDHEGIINIELSQEATAPGYVFGNQKTDTDQNIQIKATYVPHLDNDPTVEFEVIENDGFDVIVDNVNRMITIKILNESQVLFDITTEEYNTDTEAETVYISGINYTITSEIQTTTDSILTDLNVTTPLTDDQGNTKQNVGGALAGKTVVYTLHQEKPQGYHAIDDIQVEIQYDSRGYIKYYEMLSSEDNCYIVEENTTGRTISLVVMNRKELSAYTVYVEKRAMDTDDDEYAYGRTLPGAKYQITVQQQFEGAKTTTWTDVTNEDGLIKGLKFNGFGYIDITIEELEAPAGYKLDTTRYLRIYRNPDTGEMTKVDGNVNLGENGEGELTTDEEGNTIIKLIPIDEQRQDKFTLILNKISSATGKFITDNQAKFKAELIQKNEEGNAVTYYNELGVIYTDKDGKATLDNLDMPGEGGEYKLVITELEAPEGYVQLSEPVEIPITFAQSEDVVSIESINLEGLDNISATKVAKQVVGLNIKNDVDEEIGEDEYSLDITKVDAETNEPISDMAIFKVWLPDDNNTAVYTETMETLLGVGKLDYCYIEQDKDYQVRLTHMKLPTEATTLTYVFREVKAPEGYALIGEDLELTIEFATDEITNEMYIANITSSNPDYLRINTVTPCPTDTRIEIDILNNKEGQKQFTIHYDANDNGEGTVVPEDQIKVIDVDTILNTMIPEREGYTFKGWSARQTATVAEYQPGDAYSQEQDITLYAIWEEALYLNSTEYLIGTGVNPEEEWSPGQLSEYEDGDLYIKGIRPRAGIRVYASQVPSNEGTYLDEFLSNLNTNADEIKVYIPEKDVNGNIILKDENIVGQNTLIGTAMIIKLTKGEQEIQLTLIVRGDLVATGSTVGDGKITNTEAARLVTLNDRTLLTDYTIEEQQALDYFINTKNRWSTNKQAIVRAYQEHTLEPIR